MFDCVETVLHPARFKAVGEDCRRIVPGRAGADGEIELVMLLMPCDEMHPARTVGTRRFQATGTGFRVELIQGGAVVPANDSR